MLTFPPTSNPRCKLAQTRPLEWRVEHRETRAVRSRDDLVPLEEERAVILQLQRGDRQAAASLYRWYGDALYRQVLLPRLPDPDLASDCLAETFVTALTKISTYRFQEGVSIFFWLRRIAINKAMDQHRRQGRTTELPDVVSEDDAGDLVEPAEKADRNLDLADTKGMVDTSLSRLNARYALALRLRMIDDKSREECAEILGITVGNFDVLLHRAAKAFRKVYPP